MRFGPITVKDKFGRDVILRNAEPSDAEDRTQKKSHKKQLLEAF